MFFKTFDRLGAFIVNRKYDDDDDNIASFTVGYKLSEYTVLGDDYKLPNDFITFTDNIFKAISEYVDDYSYSTGDVYASIYEVKPIGDFYLNKKNNIKNISGDINASA